MYFKETKRTPEKEKTELLFNLGVENSQSLSIKECLWPQQDSSLTAKGRDGEEEGERE